MSEEGKKSLAEFGTAFFKSLLVSGLLFAVLGYILKGIELRKQGGMTHCKSNLKNIGTAVEMYSTDWDGRYPRNLSLLTPNYLETIPKCSITEVPQYALTVGVKAPGNSMGFNDFYLLECAGPNHTVMRLPPNYPMYDGIQGLTER